MATYWERQIRYEGLVHYEQKIYPNAKSVKIFWGQPELFTSGWKNARVRQGRRAAYVAEITDRTANGLELFMNRSGGKLLARTKLRAPLRVG